MPRGGKRDGAGRPSENKKAVTLRLSAENAEWLRTKGNQSKMVDSMIWAEKFQAKEALAEAIAHFLLDNSRKEIEGALGVPVKIDKILLCSRLDEVTVNRTRQNHFGFDSLAKKLDAQSKSIKLDRQQLKFLFSEITEGFRQDDWVRLNMAIRIRPVICGKTNKPHLGLPSEDKSNDD